MKSWLLALALLWTVTVGVGSAPATALAFSPDGTALVSSGHFSILVRSPQDALVRETFPCNLRRVESLCFDASGKWLLAGGGDPGISGKAVLLDWPGRKVIITFTNFSDVVTSAQFSLDGKKIALGSVDTTVRVYEAESDWTAPRLTFEADGHSGPVLGVGFGPKASLLLTASADRSLKVWDLEEKKLMRSFNHHTDTVFDVAPRPNSPAELPFQIASASGDQTVRVWQPAIGRMVRIVRGHQGAVFAVVYTPDGSALYSAGAEGVVRKIDADSDQVLKEWKAAGDAVYSLAISPDGRLLATGDWSGNVQCWDLVNQEE